MGDTWFILTCGRSQAEGAHVFFLCLFDPILPLQAKGKSETAAWLLTPMTCGPQLTHHPANVPHGETPGPAPGTVPSAGNCTSHWCAGSSSGTGSPGEKQREEGDTQSWRTLIHPRQQGSIVRHPPASPSRVNTQHAQSKAAGNAGVRVYITQIDRKNSSSSLSVLSTWHVPGLLARSNPHYNPGRWVLLSLLFYG